MFYNIKSVFHFVKKYNIYRKRYGLLRNVKKKRYGLRIGKKACYILWQA